MTHPKQVVTITELRNPEDIKRWQSPDTSIGDLKNWKPEAKPFAERYPLLCAPDRKCDKCGRRLDILVTSHGCIGSAEMVV